MALSGPAAHQQLIDAYARTQAILESERERILGARDKRDLLDDERGDALRSLAEHYLPELTDDAIADTWAEMRDSIAEVLSRKQDHARRVGEDLTRLTSQREIADSQLIEINQELDKAVASQQQVSAKVEKRLQADEQFANLSDRAAVAEAALERGEANLGEIDQEAVRKLPAYDASSLFGYLYDRGYGTPAYTRRGMTRRMDRWLARYIGFNKARQSYDFLRQTPDRMRQIIADDRASLDIVMSELERKRDATAGELGLPKLISDTQRLEKQRAAHLQSLDTILVSTEKAQRERGELDDTRGPYYRDAIELFRKKLNELDMRDLKQRAEQTVDDVTDDQIVARLQGVDSEIDQLNDATRQRRDELDQQHSFLEELGRVIQRFRAARFDSDRSNFIGSLDIDEEVDRARETANAGELWQRIRRAQRWGANESDEDNSTSQPLTRVLVNAMGNAARDERSEQARRAGTRRAQSES